VNLNTIFDLDQIEKLLDSKIKYGQLLFFNLPNMFCVFRCLTVGETESLLALSNKLNETMIEDWVVSRTLIISNKSKEFLLNRAGYLYVTNFAQKVMLASNIKEEKDYKKAVLKSRGNLSTVQGNVEILISKAFPSMSQLEIKSMSQSRQLDLLAIAEQITGVTLTFGQPRQENRRALRKFSSDAVVLGGSVDDITSKEAADIPDFNEKFE